MGALLLCENSAIDADQYDSVVFWSSFDKGENIYSIPRIVEDDYEAFKQQYLNWLHELGNANVGGRCITEHLAVRKEFSMWWMSLLVEKSQWKSPGLYNAFRLLAFDRLMQKEGIDKERISRVVINVHDQAVQKAVKKWCVDSGIEYVINTSGDTGSGLSSRRLFSALPYTLQAFSSVFYHVVSRWVARSLCHPKDEVANNSQISFISYFFNLDKSAIEGGQFFSRYWTALHDQLDHGHNKFNWLHLFVKSKDIPNVGQAAEFINKFNAKASSHQSHKLLDSELGWKTVCGVVRDYTKMWRAGWRLRKVDSLFSATNTKISLWPVLEHDWKDSIFGKTAISNCFFLNLFESAFQKLPFQRQGFYLLENQAWERSLIYAWRKAGHGQLIGVQHATVNALDLRHFNHPDEYSNEQILALPLPDKIAVNGDASRKMYRDGGFPEDRLLKVEALRYLYLDSLKDRVHSTVARDRVRLLVLGDYLPTVTQKQMQLLSDAFSNLSGKVEIFMKCHPACPIDLANWPLLEITIFDTPLDQLINEYDVAYTSNATAAAVDAYLAGKKVLTMLDPDTFNMSPLRGFPRVQFVVTPDDLIQHLFHDEETQCTSLHSDDNLFFYTDFNLPRWNKLLNGAPSKNSRFLR